MQNSFNRRADPHSSSGSERSQKVHVIPITVEGRDRPVAQRSNTPDKQAQQTEPCVQPTASHLVESAPSPVQQPFQKINERQRHSSQDQTPLQHAQQSQPQLSAAFADSESTQTLNGPSKHTSGRVINIPIKVERECSFELPMATPRLGNYSDSHIPNLAGGIHPKSSTPGQKQSTASRPQYASFSDLPLKQQQQSNAFSNYATTTKNFVPQPSDGQPETQPTSSSNRFSLKPESTETEKIQEIVDEVKKLESEVDSFKGTAQDKQYRYLDEYLTRNLIRLDQIETNGDQEIRLARKNAITLIENVISKLENNGKAPTKEKADSESNETEIMPLNSHAEERSDDSEKIGDKKETDSEQEPINMDSDKPCNRQEQKSGLKSQEEKDQQQIQ